MLSFSRIEVEMSSPQSASESSIGGNVQVELSNSAAQREHRLHYSFTVSGTFASFAVGILKTAGTQTCHENPSTPDKRAKKNEHISC